jgi:hypothetical protein
MMRTTPDGARVAYRRQESEASAASEPARTAGRALSAACQCAGLGGYSVVSHRGIRTKSLSVRRAPAATWSRRADAGWWASAPLRSAALISSSSQDEALLMDPWVYL